MARNVSEVGRTLVDILKFDLSSCKTKSLDSTLTDSRNDYLEVSVSLND